MNKDNVHSFSDGKTIYWLSFEDWKTVKQWRKEKESQLNPFRIEITEEEYLKKQWTK